MNTGTDTMKARKLGILDLPNEVLISILTTFPTHALLNLTLISRQFHHLILRILHFRLLLAASTSEHKIILEAYLPFKRYTRPDLFCTYLGTNGLSSKTEGEGSLYHDCDGDVSGRLAKLSRLYSRFRPEYPAEEGKIPLRRIAGAAPNLQSSAPPNADWYQTNQPGFDTLPAGSAVPGAIVTGPGATAAAENNGGEGSAAAHPLQMQPIFGNQGDGGSRKVVYTLGLDGDELFGQFCIAASLVRLGPRRGVFLSTVRIDGDKQGVIRVWRHWLLDRAETLSESERRGSYPLLEKTPTNISPEDIIYDKNVLWTDSRKNVGLRLAIRERPIPGVEQRTRDEDKDDIPLSFDIEVQELIVRTTHLMLAVEVAQELAQTPGGNAAFLSWTILGR